MRVISQGGEIDVPYDLFVFGITIDNRVTAIRDSVARPYECTNGFMAKYSTKEKALKAMKMLREKYLSRMELDGGYDVVNKCYVQPNYWVLPKVFQFPQDDEIEV
jgi:hypothetical protein